MMKGLQNKIEALMHCDAVTTLPHLGLYLVSLLYGAGVRARLLFYSTGIFRARRLPCRVISVGNITVGGTGKTPAAMLIARLIQASGAKAVILSRGYRRRSNGFVVVSDYSSVLAKVEDAGDEPLLMARRLIGVPVVVSVDRAGAGALICEKFKPDYIILDDGFQHLGLARDVNIMLVDGLAGFGNGHLLPAGILREPLSSMRRADAVMVKDAGRGRWLIERLSAKGFKPLNFTYRPAGLAGVTDAHKADIDPDALKNKKVVAVAGIANPASFFAMLEKLRINVAAALAFPDHHWFTSDDMKSIMAAVERTGAEAVVTTEKDGVRLAAHAAGGVPVYALRVDAVCDEEELKRLIFGHKP